MSRVRWQKRGKGLTSSMTVDDPAFGALTVKYSIKQGPHAWDVSLRVFDAVDGSEAKEFRRRGSFPFHGDNEGLEDAKSAVERHWQKMESGRYGESPDLKSLKRSEMTMRRRRALSRRPVRPIKADAARAIDELAETYNKVYSALRGGKRATSSLASIDREAAKELGRAIEEIEDALGIYEEILDEWKWLAD